jgi:hypothetical protein
MEVHLQRWGADAFRLNPQRLCTTRSFASQALCEAEPKTPAFFSSFRSAFTPVRFPP